MFIFGNPSLTPLRFVISRLPSIHFVCLHSSGLTSDCIFASRYSNTSRSNFNYLVALWCIVRLKHYLCLNQLKTCYNGKIKQDRQVDSFYYRRA